MWPPSPEDVKQLDDARKNRLPWLPPRRTLLGHQNWITAVDMSPDDAFVASTGFDRTVRVWDVESGELKYTLEGHDAIVRSVSFAHDGSLLASAGGDKRIRIWDMETGRQLGASREQPGLLRTVRFSPVDMTLACAGEDKVIRLAKVKRNEAGDATLTEHARWHRYRQRNAR